MFTMNGRYKALRFSLALGSAAWTASSGCADGVEVDAPEGNDSPMRDRDASGLGAEAARDTRGPATSSPKGEVVAGDPAPSSAPVAPDARGPSMELRCQADATAAQATDYARPGPHAVGTLELTLEDKSRPIVATSKHGAAPLRRLVTTVYYPASGPAPLFGRARVAKGGPFPLLMYSHGYSSSRNEASGIARRAASHGYVVVAPDFPLTNLLANLGAPDIDDASNQPDDVSFLIDRMLAFSADPSHLLAGAIDEERIGALGVSLGGFTTLLVSLHPELHDPRIKVAMPIAAVSSFFLPGFYHTRALPLLFVHGNLDAFVEYERNARRAFERAKPNARLLTVDKGSHAAFAATIDPSLVPLLGPFISAPNAHPSNPDGVGCGAVGKTLGMTGASFLAPLGGPENFVDPAAGLLPCQGDEFTRPAMNAGEQQELLVRSAVAFFDAHLGATAASRRDGCRYLVHEVTKHPAVKLEE